MRKELICVLLFVGFVSLVNGQFGRFGGGFGRRCPRPTGFGICISNCEPGWGGRRCPRGQICCRNACGGFVCTPRGGGGGGGGGGGVPPWCPAGSPRIRCFVNPCTVDTCPSFPRARCVNDNPCEPSCHANFYLGFRRIPRWQCQSRRPMGGWRGR